MYQKLKSEGHFQGNVGFLRNMFLSMVNMILVDWQKKKAQSESLNWVINNEYT